MSKKQQAEKIVRNYTLLAMATGTIPLPATSAAIVGESAAMISHVAAIYGSSPFKVGRDLILIAHHPQFHRAASSSRRAASS